MDINQISDIERDFNTPRFLHLVHPDPDMAHPLYVTGKGGNKNMALKTGEDPDGEGVEKIGFMLYSAQSDKFFESEDRVAEQNLTRAARIGNNKAKMIKQALPSKEREHTKKICAGLIAEIFGIYEGDRPLDASDPKDRLFALNKQWIVDQVDAFTKDVQNFSNSGSGDTN